MGRALFLLGLLPGLVFAQHRETSRERIVDLRGTWLFHLGDDPAWANADFPDEDWSTLFVPSIWENQGYEGYDGYAWYRKHFHLPATDKDAALILHLGRIDDAGMVYVNGHYVGSIGTFPPKFKTGYHEQRDFFLPPEYLRYGATNVIAVRLYDAYLEGGLREGQPGLYRVPPASHDRLVLDLRGLWNFAPGDHPNGSQPGLDDRSWSRIIVPGYWEPQGFEDHNGYAWYRKRFYLPASFERGDLLLLLGQIDDLDETYLNGHLIGHTGDLRRGHIRGDEWTTLRVYPIPSGLLRYGGENVVAVRVFDGLQYGGIHQGPVGLITRENLAFLQHNPPESLWRKLLRLLTPEQH